jgi:hypothetical protein
MHHRRWYHTQFALFAALIVAMSGCGSKESRSPLAPMDAHTQDQAFSALGGRTGPSSSGLVAQPPGPSSPQGKSSAAPMDGSIGGELEVGRYRVIIPPGAFAGTRQVSLVPSQDPGELRCEIRPQSLEFQIPVLLQINVLDTIADVSGVVIEWEDTNARRNPWVSVGGLYDEGAHTVSALVAHGGNYRVPVEIRAGRAGW